MIEFRGAKIYRSDQDQKRPEQITKTLGLNSVRLKLLLTRLDPAIRFWLNLGGSVNTRKDYQRFVEWAHRNRKRKTPEVYWQFSNGKLAKFDDYSTNIPVSTYHAWDRSLGGYVIYARGTVAGRR